MWPSRTVVRGVKPNSDQNNVVKLVPRLNEKPWQSRSVQTDKNRTRGVVRLRFSLRSQVTHVFSGQRGRGFVVKPKGNDNLITLRAFHERRWPAKESTWSLRTCKNSCVGSTVVWQEDPCRFCVYRHNRRFYLVFSWRNCSWPKNTENGRDVIVVVVTSRRM